MFVLAMKCITKLPINYSILHKRSIVETFIITKIHEKQADRPSGKLLSLPTLDKLDKKSYFIQLSNIEFGRSSHMN